MAEHRVTTTFANGPQRPQNRAGGAKRGRAPTCIPRHEWRASGPFVQCIRCERALDLRRVPRAQARSIIRGCDAATATELERALAAHDFGESQPHGRCPTCSAHA